MRKSLGLLFVALLLAPAAWAQQTGSIAGRVTSTDGAGLPGVVVEARSDVLPRPRATTTLDNGDFLLPQLPPGVYALSFRLEGLARVDRDVEVLLDQQTSVQVMLAETIEESIEVVSEGSLLSLASAEVKSEISEVVLDQVPVGQDYRDLQKLIPGVQYSENSVRGPSAGGSGQDNVYLFDGVSVNLPLFGNLSSEPSKHDVEQVSIVKGGSRAVDFHRAGGFTIDTVSKSGTNRFRGEASYQLQTAGMTEDREDPTLDFDEDRDWATVGVGGPVVQDNLYFYASYFRPTVDRDNVANVYGPVPDFESTRDELFGKLTWTPSSSVLLSGSYRDSEREDSHDSVGSTSAASTSVGNEATLEIGILEGSWIINDRNFVTLKATDFANENLGRPDRIVNVPVALDGSVSLDIANLDQIGHLLVPSPIAGNDAHNAFIAPIIGRYGYLENGMRIGGGDVGVHDLLNDQDFFRQSFQVGYDYLFGEAVSHELHVGYQWFSDEEQLARTSNGWGIISVPGGRTSFQGQPIFYQARLLAGAAGAIPIGDLSTEYESHNVEVNDTIRWNNWTFNVGVLLSQDTLYGQGLRETSATTSGFEPAPGNRYEMYKVDWDEMIQPRLGATWAYNGQDTLYGSYARYNPSASSLPRAAAWDRNFFLRTVDVFFDADGDFIGTSQVAGSSGKLFADDLDPRFVEEFLLGTARRFNARWTGRAYARYRYASSFWEDTNNNARLLFDPPAGVPQELYIPTNNLVGSGSYVIAELDGAFTKFWEATLEGERRAGDLFVRGSYTWSHYYGNFDQDNTTTDNDDNIFIGSSFIADSAGRQVWDNKYGDLRGDRRHLVKVYGYYRLPWNATTGAFAVYQSGEPWEAWDVEHYRGLLNQIGSTSTSSTGRFAESAGSRTSDDHYQIDLNYTQSFPFGERYNAQLVVDLFNLTDNQTGYNINPFVSSSTFGEPRSYYAPRRLRLGVRLEF
ncbi:MAG TPA: carboxypeptidase regulatory-like domain-containing protein [Thermoanaerobaculia bacterium]|nr:carboxypeptidase regulatory-like domain-containing protein [Thermoanaerobaculia bacterium]